VIKLINPIENWIRIGIQKNSPFFHFQKLKIGIENEEDFLDSFLDLIDTSLD
jgi:hypothetical protein